MKHNDISRTISNQIAMWYTPDCDNILVEHKQISAKRISLVESVKGKGKILTNNSVTYAVEKYPIMPILMSVVPSKRQVYLVGPTLKNTVNLYPGGEYANFIVKWSNYTANKKHTSANFTRFADVFLGDSINLATIDNKLDDIADGFMMVFAWLKKHNML